MKRHDEIVLEPGVYSRQYWHDLLAYRELFYVLAWRDIAVRYKQTVIGVAWAVIRPLLTMIVLTVVFGKIAKLPSDVPYPLLVMSGLLPWTLFSTALGEASGSLIANANLISKVYFPRMIVPTAAIITSVVDFLIGLVLLFAIMLYYRFVPNWPIVFLPLFVFVAFLASLGPGLYFTALNVKYRDFRYVIPFFVQFGLYISPVGFSSELVDEKWRLFYYVNPMAGVIDCFRWCLLGVETPPCPSGLFVSFAVIVVFLWLGVSKFRSMEQSFADVI